MKGRKSAGSEYFLLPAIFSFPPEGTAKERPTAGRFLTVDRLINGWKLVQLAPGSADGLTRCRARPGSSWVPMER